MYKINQIILIIIIIVLCTSITHAQNIIFFESPLEGGYAKWDDPANIATHDAWLMTVGEMPDFREDWEGNDWTGQPWYHGQLFDSQITSATFGGGATFSNVGADTSSRAYASDGRSCNLGCSVPIGNLSWRGNQTNQSTIDFGSNPANYLGFFIFDTDHPPYTLIVYNIQFSDGTIESVVGKNAYQNHYLFVGFVNIHPSASFEKFWIDAYSASRYGIDEIEWGSNKLVPKPVSIDIEPGSCPNPFNLKGGGVLPIAVLGSEEFDVTTIDPSTIKLSREGIEAKITPLRWAYEDVATPFRGDLCDCHDLNEDGYEDLTLKFSKQELVNSLELCLIEGETIPLTLIASLDEDNTSIEGQDCIWVLK